jgi:hypothetical protein
MSTNFSSSDKASKKQLAWERGREDFMQGNSWKKTKKQQQHKKNNFQRSAKQAAGVKRPPKKKQKR